MQILALASLVLTISGEKYKTICSSRGGRKTKLKADQPIGSTTDRDRLGAVQALVGQLQTVLGDVDQSIGECLDCKIIFLKNSWQSFLFPYSVYSFFFRHAANWTAPLCPDNLVDRIAAMSLNPNVEPLVQTTLREGHRIAVEEMRAIVREKQRMLRGRD